MSNEIGSQAKRCIFIYKKLAGGRAYFTEEIHNIICEEFGEISLRTVQRDLKMMLDEYSEIEKRNYEGKTQWYMHRYLRPGDSAFRFNSNMLLSLYFLKAHLRTFKGTSVEDHALGLLEELEEMAPGNTVSSKSLFFDKNIGHYDYTQYDPEIIRLIKCITEEKLCRIHYDTGSEGRINKFDAVPRKFFLYSGLLYVASYIPHHDGHVALAVHNIEQVDIKDKNIDLPEFDFDTWSENRFGVFSGEIMEIEILIRKSVRHYFENRSWHKSQEFIEKDNGDIILKMKASVTPELIAWIMGWGENLKVLKPGILQSQIKDKAAMIHELYS